jgi:hypothetical protein
MKEEAGGWGQSMLLATPWYAETIKKYGEGNATAKDILKATGKGIFPLVP